MIQIPSIVTRFGAKAGAFFVKHGPTMMSVGGGAMAVGGAILACKATLHADEVLERHRDKLTRIAAAKKVSDVRVEAGDIEYGDEIYSEKMMKRDKAIVYLETGVEFAKLYGPAVALGLGGIGMMQGAYAIMNVRHGKAIAALTTLDQAYTALVARHESIGDSPTYESLPASVIDIQDEDGETSKQVVVDTDATIDPFFFIFDALNPNWAGGSGFLLNERFLTAQIDAMNYELQGHSRNYAWVNDLLKRWGMEETDIGHFYGWNGTAGDVIEYILTPYIYGDDLLLEPTTMDKLRDMELQDIQDGYCIGIRLYSSSDGYPDIVEPRMIYNEVYNQ